MDADISQAAFEQALQDNDWDRAHLLCASLRESTELHLEYALWAARIQRAARNDQARCEGLCEIMSLISDRRSIDWRILSEVVTEIEMAGRIEDAANIMKRFPEVEAGTKMRDAMEQRLDVAKRLQKIVEGTRHAVIALGQQCMAHDILTRWGIGTHLIEGPFVAGVFSHDAAATAIEDRFVHFFDAQSYKIVKTLNGVQAITIPAYRALLNHETGPYWLTDPTKVEKLYRNRAEAFTNALQIRSNVLVFTQTNTAEIGRLLRSIESFTRGSSYHLVLVDCSHTSEFGYYESNPRVTFVRSPVPREDYVWYEPLHYNTPEGLAFERPIAEAITAALQSP